MLFHGLLLRVCRVGDVQSLLYRSLCLDSFGSIVVCIGVGEIKVLNEHVYCYFGLFGLSVEAEP
ncbi:hypothetical protein J7K27_05305 [Candidatus Bathyarchaeota archaeon]|nr:hypothetical protein [Candidatus Bathyarchaeota archaeon]